MAQPEPAPLGTPEAYREFIGETLAMAALTADLGVTYASIGDDIGLEYSTRNLVAYVKAALNTMGHLRAMKSEMKERAHAA